jgi:hypothetical protein
MDGACAYMRKVRSAYRYFHGKPGRKKPLSKPRLKGQGYIKTGLKELVWDGVDWIHLAEDRDT